MSGIQLSAYSIMILAFIALAAMSPPHCSATTTESAKGTIKAGQKNQYGKIDIGIFQSSDPNTIDIKVRPNFLIESDPAQVISDIRYTIKWADPLISLTDIPKFPFHVSAQGSPEPHDGHYYQVYSSQPMIPYDFDIGPGEEVIIASFEYSGNELDFFEIARDEWTDENNGGFFIEFNGEDVTGIIYQRVVTGEEKILDIRVLLEGAYNIVNESMRTDLNAFLPSNQPYDVAPWSYPGNEEASSFHPDVVDWVLVEFIDAKTAQEAISKNSFLKKALLVTKNGNLLNQNMLTPKLLWDGAIQNDLFVIIRHRNHIDILGGEAMSYDSSTSTYSYDFSLSIDKAYGGEIGYKEIGPGHYGMVAGDSNGDNNVNTQDFNFWRQNAGLENVYNEADFSLSGDVSASDFNVWRRNAGTSSPF